PCALILPVIACPRAALADRWAEHDEGACEKRFQVPYVLVVPVMAGEGRPSTTFSAAALGIIPSGAKP
ncbi:MAG TPA: hypothetical protein VHY76_01830, partial [Acetobacteraceae bacterium]|nr:hypothetical protein [Acetobacteraceae bacterium]